MRGFYVRVSHTLKNRPERLSCWVLKLHASTETVAAVLRLVTAFGSLKRLSVSTSEDK